QADGAQPPGVADAARVDAHEGPGDDPHHDVDADGDDRDHEDRLADHRPDGDPLDDQGHRRDRDDAKEGAEPEPEPWREVADQDRAGQHERRLGEADDLHRLVDDHEAEREQRVDRAVAQAHAPRGEELVHAVPPSASSAPTRAVTRSPYISCTRWWKARSIAERLTFCVAVSSPSSWSSSLGSIRKSLICSTGLCLLLTSSTTPRTRVRTSGFSERSR